MAVLDVWIARPGSACRMDDHAWLVTIYDAHDQIFEWAGIKYTDLPAPQGHWAGKVPPGTYVVQAVSPDTGRSTDHAIVAVDCADAACVRLYVPAPGRRPPDACKITIVDVRGEGGPDRPALIQVSGKAANCQNVEVTLSCRTDQQLTIVVPVSAGGQWLAVFREKIKRLECTCGGPAIVIARCRDNRDCMTRWEGKLPCDRRHEPG